MKKIKYIALIFILSFCFYITSNAVENIEIQEPKITFTFDNYYKYNEELHNKNLVDRNVFYSDINTVSLEEYLIKESVTCPESINISQYQIPLELVEEELVPFLYYDELFYINAFSVTVDEESNMVSEIYFNYILTPSKVKEAWNIINNEVENYKLGIKPEWSELEKVLYTNNFLCQNCEYANNIIDTSHTLYGAFVDKKPVCDGYSHAFRYLLKQVGIDVSIATSTSMNHAWNLVKIDNEYYHIDVTWNDSYYNAQKGVGKTAYEFFLASDTSFMSERKTAHSGWVADVKATSTKFDVNIPWQNQTNYLIYKDNYWYYIDNKLNTYNFNLFKINLREESIENITVKENTTEDYIFVAPGFTTDGTNLYFSTEYKIYKMDFMGENLENIFEIPEKDKCIYSLEIIDNVFYYDTLNEEISSGYKIARPETRSTNIYNDYKTEEILVYTTVDTDFIDDTEIMIFDKGKIISDFIVSENFPILDKSYVIEVYDINNELKTDLQKIGSKNIIKIKDPSNTYIVKEYIVVVLGDVTGDGIIRMYDAFQILKDTILSSDTLPKIDKIIRDYNQDGIIRMYDAFSFLKLALFN